MQRDLEMRKIGEKMLKNGPLRRDLEKGLHSPEIEANMKKKLKVILS